MNKNATVSKVKLYGRPNSPQAYELRDFFNRSVVEFDWIKLTCDAGYLITGSDLPKKGRPDCWTLDRDPFYLETSVPGSFAAEDVRHGSVKRVASAVGEGAMAVTFVRKVFARN